MRLIFDIFKFSVIYFTFVFLVAYAIVGPSDAPSTSNLAETNSCVYDVSKDITFTHNIKSVRNYQEGIENIASKVKQCNVSLQARINDEWVTGNGSFIYGPDTSETSACFMAAEKAKSDALQSKSPEVITASIRNKCETRS